MKRRLFIFGISLMMLILLASCSSAPTFEEQYELGLQYLSEGNYEEAIIAFTVAIEIDPKRVEAYVSRGDSYVGAATTGDSDVEDNYTAALNDYHYAIELDNLITDIYHKLADIYIFFGDIEAAVAILEQGYTVTQNEIIKESISKLRRQLNRSALLKELYDLFEAGITNEALVLINNTEDFADLCADVQESSPQIYQPTSERGIGIYQARESDFGEYYVYYGDYEGDIRKGIGLWCIVNNDEYYIFNGTWDTDAPNGNGEVKEWYGGLNEGMSYRQKVGTLINGLWEGDMLWQFIYPERIDSFPVHFENGFCTILEIRGPDEDNDEFSYVMSNTGTNPDRNGDAVMSSYSDISGFVYGIAGFEDRRK